MKTILVLAGGSATDEAVFHTALAAARPFGAHLDFLHVRVGPGEAAAVTPNLGFAMGSALHEVLHQLQAEAKRRSAAAARHFRRFCEREAIGLADAPGSPGVSAAWREQRGDAVEHMMLRARRHDLVVLGRPSRPNGLPSDLIELLLLGCGRPILVAPAGQRRSVTGTALVFWNETAASARALAAALPLLSLSRRVVVVGVEEPGGGSLDGTRDVARQLAWHGIDAASRWIAAETRAPAELLEAAAAHDDADLLVMGGYGHWRAREMIFGGCTRHFLDRAERPVLMMH